MTNLVEDSFFIKLFRKFSAKTTLPVVEATEPEPKATRTRVTRKKLQEPQTTDEFVVPNHSAPLNKKPQLPKIEAKNILLALSALFPLFTAYVAQVEFRADNPTAGSIFAITTIILAILLFRSRNEGNDSPVLGEEAHAEKKPLLFLIPFALVAAFISFRLTDQNAMTPMSVKWWGISLILWMVAFWRPSLKEMKIQFENMKQWTGKITWVHVGLCIIIAIGTIFRLYKIDQIPADMWHDITENMHNVQDILTGNWLIYSQRNTGAETLLFYITALFVLFFGKSFVLFKTITAVIGILVLPIVFITTRKCFSTPVALLATFFLAVSKWHIIINRTGWRANLMPLVSIITIWFFYQALTSKRRSWYLATGIALGIGFFTYTSYRIMPGVLGIMALVHFMITQENRREWVRSFARNFGLLIVTSLLVMLPLLRYVSFSPAQDEGSTAGTKTYPQLIFYLSRIAERVAEGEPQQKENIWPQLVENIKKHSLMFTYKGDAIARQNVALDPALDFTTGMFFLIGIGIVLARIFSFRYASVFLVLILGQLPSLMNFHYPAEVPAFVRSSMSLPFTFIIAALGCWALIEHWKQYMPFKKLSLLVALLLFIPTAHFAIAANWQKVFVEYPQGLYYGNFPFYGTMASILNATGDKTDIVMVSYPHWDEGHTIQAQIKSSKSLRVIAPEQPLSCQDELRPSPSGATAKLYLINPGDTTKIDLIRECFPNEVRQDYTNTATNQIQFTSLLVELSPLPTTPTLTPAQE